MLKYVLVAFLMLLSFTAGIWFTDKIKKGVEIIKLQSPKLERPQDIYTIENLSREEIRPGKFLIKEILKEEEKFTSYLFDFEFNPNLDGKTFKTTTGQINLPAGRQASRGEKFPIILMLRGYINQETFTTGDGTRNAAAFFAENGFITVSPDFLGYGGSNKEADNIFESRFQTYLTVLSLLKSLSAIEQFNNEAIFLWGHSNGGQIALTVLEITGADYPTTLWAPVSKPFPYSVLYYTDESEDRGRLIRRELAKFEETYNPDLYSLDLHLEKINAPLQIHQGTLDEAVPKDWSDGLFTKLKELGKEVTYYKYPGADHNMRPIEFAWNMVVARDLKFFTSFVD